VPSTERSRGFVSTALARPNAAANGFELSRCVFESRERSLRRGEFASGDHWAAGEARDADAEVQEGEMKKRGR